MAAAGFYHCPTNQEPDLVKCFICMKELDGWEPTDEPMEEHRAHAPKCPFVTGKRFEKDMKMKDMWKLEIARQTTRVNKMIEEKIAEFEKYAAEVRSEMEKLA